jgi:Flp pilus assembly protein TadD
MTKSRRRVAPDAARKAWKIRLTGRRRAALIVCGIVVLAALAVAADWWRCLPDDTVATYVGRGSCAECHAKEVQAWTGSFHDRAMDLATPQTVLGDFNNVEFKHFDITSRMYRRDGKYMIHTEGPDGRMHDYEVKYVFGAEPLQNYMVEFDRTPDMAAGEIARLQVLRITWDSKQKRWFYLPPPDVSEKLSPDDDLHWTRIAQNWNHMCADCHSTNLQKNYDVASRTYRTTFSEIDVSCETCHGPASLHVELARSRSLFWDRKRGYALAGLKDADSHVQIHACAPCHSRRRSVYPDPRPGENYYNYFDNELLQASTYYADGQIQDEDYELGSFVQSKMYHKGIRCSDCHDPHSLRTRYTGNHVCTSCHQHPAGKYDAVAHHRHEAGSQAALCTECHMPKTSYMEVDPRLDHSLRVPRPDLSVRLGTPNACSKCHLDKGKLDPAKAAKLEEYSDWLTAASNGDVEVREALARVDQWCAEKFREWYGEKPDERKHFANTLTAARRRDTAAEKPLLDLVRDRSLAAIVRATGLLELAQYPSPAVTDASEELLRDFDPQVRAGAISNLQSLPDEELVRSVSPLLNDPIRLVRTEAARVLARVPMSLLKGSQRRSLESALEEYKAGVLVNSDRASAHLSLGVLYEFQHDLDAARKAYETAIHVEPSVSGPRTNLAALLDGMAEQANQRAGGPSSEADSLRAESARLRREELALIERDAHLAPQSAALQYRYGMLLYLHNRLDEAEKSLVKAYELEPTSPDFVLALALFYQKQQRLDKAVELVRKLIEMRPDDPTYRQLLEELRRG